MWAMMEKLRICCMGTRCRHRMAQTGDYRMRASEPGNTGAYSLPAEGGRCASAGGCLPRAASGHPLGPPSFGRGKESTLHLRELEGGPARLHRSFHRGFVGLVADEQHHHALE